MLYLAIKAYQSNRLYKKYNIQRSARKHQLFSYSIHSWQVDKINEPPVELLPVRESILTKAGFIVATGSVECESRMRLWMAALSFCLCLQLSVSLSLLPSVELSLLAHTMCPLDCHLQSDPKDQDQPALACALHTSTHPERRAENTHTQEAP